MNSYSVNGINGFGNYINDPYFLAALQSYNPNFRGAQAEQEAQLQAMQYSQAAANSQQAATTEGIQQAETIPALYALNNGTAEESNGISAGNLIVGGALLAATIGGYIYTKGKGKGNFIEGLKNIWNGIKGSSTKTLKGNKPASTTIVARRVNGKNIYTIPNKTETITKNIENYARKNGINLGFGKTNFNSELSKITEAEFDYLLGNVGYTVKIKDGNFEIFDGAGKALREIWEKDSDKTAVLAEITERVGKIQSGVVKGNYSAFKGLRNIEYSNAIGDDIISVSRNTLNKTGQAGEKNITELTTLKRFDENSDEVQAYFKNNAGTEEKYTAKSIRRGKLPEGLTPCEFDTKIGHNTFYFDKGKVVGVKIGDRYYKDGSIIADAEINRNKEKIEKLIKQVYVDKTLIPNGLTFC